MALVHYLSTLAGTPALPSSHRDFLQTLRDDSSFFPKVVYDLGACLLHWASEAKVIWPTSQIFLCDGFAEAEPLWKASGHDYALCVLSDQEKDITFYVNPLLPGGNSYYREVGGPNSETYFPPSSGRLVRTTTLDTLRREKNWPFPDLVKMDVQGAELDIYRGATETLRSCRFLILELQHKQYNEGAPLAHEVLHALAADGWELFAPLFTLSEFDGDYCFINTRLQAAATEAQSIAKP